MRLTRADELRVCLALLVTYWGAAAHLNGWV